MREQSNTPEHSTYTGPERRWMQSRAWSDWSHRNDHFENRAALETARHIDILAKLRAQALKRKRSEEAGAIWSGMWELQQKLAQWRKRVAEDTAPWFNEKAFP